jgi:hypothetical protein
MTPLDNVVGMQQNIANPVRCKICQAYKLQAAQMYEVTHGNKK